jgi:hypothetical protein
MTVRHLLVVAALEFEVKNALVFQQENQVRTPRQGNRQFAVQDLPHGNAAGQLIQQARVVALE